MILFTESETKSGNKFKEPAIFFFALLKFPCCFYNFEYYSPIFLHTLSNYVLGPGVHSLILSEMKRYEANFDV